MRGIIAIGALLAFFGLAVVAHASDSSKSIDRDGVSTTGEASHDVRADRKDRYERKHHARDGHDESNERSRERHEPRERHESREHHDRR